MTGKTPKGKVIVENDIEKNREDGNWNRVIELADLLIKPKTTPLYSFLVGEAKLESYLEENAPVEKNIDRARTGLIECRNYLLESVTEQGEKCGVALDGHLLLGKLQYAMGDYEGALEHFTKAGLHKLSEKVLAPRSIRIISESFAIKGLCLEHLPPHSPAIHAHVEKVDRVKHCYETDRSFPQLLREGVDDKSINSMKRSYEVEQLSAQSLSKDSHNEWVDQVKHCYEIASDLGLLYLQQKDKQYSSNTVGSGSMGSHSPQPMTHHQNPLSLLIETAILRQPVFLIKHGKIPESVSFYRNVLTAVEANGTHSIRLTLCRLLAELLLHNAAGTLYPSFTDKKVFMSPWKPNKYRGINIFSPRNECEEVILLLLISEAMAARNAVLSQSSEFKEARLRALTNAIAVYDLLTVVLVRWRQFALLQESLDRAMKFSSDEYHVWLQHVLCLDAAGQHSRAFSMIKEVIRLRKSETQPKLMAARIAYQHLNKIDEGLRWSEEALACELENPHNLLSRCHLSIGIGAHCKAYSVPAKSLREYYNSVAFDSFTKCHELDPGDHLAKYYLGLHAAFQGAVSIATSHVRSALNLYPEHVPSLHLMILLLTAQKQMKEAFELLDSTLRDYPDNIHLYILKIHLELDQQNNETALIIAKRMLSLWKTYSNQSISSNHSDNRLLSLQEFSDKGSNSILAPQYVNFSKTEHTMSEMASSSIGSSLRRQTNNSYSAWMMQHKIWLLLAEIYLKQDQLVPASNCLQEAISILPLSYHSMFVKGRIQQQKNEFFEAKQSYQNAVSLNPGHVPSLQQLGLMYHYFGNNRMAEKLLRNAVKLDPFSSQTWYNLGTVMEAVGEVQSATDCLAKALYTETISPVLPYNSIPITFE